MNQRRKEKGITLVALVITIILMLILAGVAISALTGENGLIGKAQNAAEIYQNGAEREKNEIENLLNWSGGGESVTIPEGLEVGSTVTYTPSGTYKWQAEYCSSTKTVTGDDVTLDSSASGNYQVSSWRVLDIDRGTGEVTLIAATPTTGLVYLGEAQGYNNGVTLLNEACSSLYGNSSKGITARSINIEDIEGKMTNVALNEAHVYTNSDSNTKYGNQVLSPYTSKKSYPSIYAKESLSAIDETTNRSGLEMSDRTNLIGRTEDKASSGYLEAKTSIQPYQTYWYKDATDMTTAFQTADNGTSYYELIMPKGTSTTYWVASRCVYIYSDYCRLSYSPRG